jgi:hypothetical protein
MTKPKKKPAGRIMRHFRLSPKINSLLKRLAQHLTAKDGVRVVTETEVIERALHAMARECGLLPQDGDGQ